MKSFIGLALIAVLCAVEVSAVITNPRITIEDKLHDNKDDRETVVSCNYDKTDDTGVTVDVMKTDEVPPKALFQVTATASKLNEITGKITKADFVATNTDGQKTTFTLKKKDGAPNPLGSYNCEVTSNGVKVTSPTKKIYVDSEIITFDVAVKDAGEKKDEFKNDGQLDASCTYDVPAGETLKSLEVSAVEKPIATGTFDGTKFTFAYPKPEGFSDVVAKEEGKKVTVTVTKLTDKSGGVFKCKYDVEDDTAEKNKKTITSKTVELKHVNGAAANVASLGLLVLAVTSYIKLSL
ncbi:unnamed protein product [Medioppia subpectinata]|uniref:Uncharacterized protein n=1 Tax=Medioppia subpectinata TaxID=1979941 RepID=A0A7R9PYM2_9ACAR|nr:unnamed protein product [Medioppia subpectinata]CAG2106222.1 unnamed protein product [Medioppia subpectinata]